MPLKQLSFCIVRKAGLDPERFIDLVCDPALELDLSGRLIFHGCRKYVVMLEGEKRKIDDFKTYIWVGRPAIGSVLYFTEFDPSGSIYGDGIDVEVAPERGGKKDLPDHDEDESGV